MSESIPTQESGADKFPSLDKVLEGFNRIVENAELKVLDKAEDGKGLLVFDVEAKLPNGDTIQCCYKRARTIQPVPYTNKPGSNSGMEAPSRIISTILSEEPPYGSVGPEFDFINGEWVEVK
jgi:hypothetical protein